MKRCGTHYDIGVGVGVVFPTIQVGVWHSLQYRWGCGTHQSICKPE